MLVAIHLVNQPVPTAPQVEAVTKAEHQYLLHPSLVSTSIFLVYLHVSKLQKQVEFMLCHNFHIYRFIQFFTFSFFISKNVKRTLGHEHQICNIARLRLFSNKVRRTLVQNVHQLLKNKNGVDKNEKWMNLPNDWTVNLKNFIRSPFQSGNTQSVEKSELFVMTKQHNAK